jgi:hypothetical protein
MKTLSANLPSPFLFLLFSNAPVFHIIPGNTVLTAAETSILSHTTGVFNGAYNN